MNTSEARLCTYVRSIKRHFCDVRKSLGVPKNANLDGSKKCDIEGVARKSVDGSGSPAVDAECEGTKVVGKPFESIPGPLSLPVFGTLWKYLPFIGMPALLLRS